MTSKRKSKTVKTVPLRLRATTALTAAFHKLPNVALGATAISLGGIGVSVNATYYAGMGASSALPLLGICTDVLAVVLPTVVSRVKDRVQKTLGWALWGGAVAMTLLATSGWSSQNIGDAVMAREIVATQTASVVERLHELQGERRDITEGRSAQMIESALHGHCNKRCKADLTAAKATADHRDRLDSEIAYLSGKLGTVKAVSAADSGASMVASLLHVRPADVASARVLGLTVLPASAGLLLSLAWSGAVPTGTTRKAPVKRRKSPTKRKGRR